MFLSAAWSYSCLVGLALLPCELKISTNLYAVSVVEASTSILKTIACLLCLSARPPDRLHTLRYRRKAFQLQLLCPFFWALLNFYDRILPHGKPRTACTAVDWKLGAEFQSSGCGYMYYVTCNSNLLHVKIALISWHNAFTYPMCQPHLNCSAKCHCASSMHAVQLYSRPLPTYLCAWQEMAKHMVSRTCG